MQVRFPINPTRHPTWPERIVYRVGVRPSVELASSSIQQKWNCKLVKIDHLYLDLRGCRHFRDPQMTVGSKIDYRRNRAGMVTNTL